MELETFFLHALIYKKQILILGIEEKKELYEMYPKSYDDIMYFKKSKYEYLQLFSSLDIGYAFSVFSKRIISTRVGSHSRGDYVSKLYNTSYLDTIKCGCFDLNRDTQLHPPIVPDADIRRFIDEFDLIKKRTIIVNPYANSIVTDCDAFLSELVLRLKKDGFQVVTNLSNNKQKPIPGTKGMVCSLTEAYKLASYCGFVVGARSGFMDFTAYADCVPITLFDEKYPYYEFIRLSKWGINPKVKDIILTSDNNKNIENVVRVVMNEQ